MTARKGPDKYTTGREAEMYRAHEKNKAFIDSKGGDLSMRVKLAEVAPHLAGLTSAEDNLDTVPKLPPEPDSIYRVKTNGKSLNVREKGDAKGNAKVIGSLKNGEQVSIVTAATWTNKKGLEYVHVQNDDKTVDGYVALSLLEEDTDAEISRHLGVDEKMGPEDYSAAKRIKRAQEEQGA